MDTVTHTLIGAVTVRATAPKEASDKLPIKTRVFVGGLTAAFPDYPIDLH